MPKLKIICGFLIILLTMFTVPVHASVSVTGTISDNIYVVYNFENLNSTVYDEIKTNQQFNISTIPTIIEKNLKNQGLEQIRWGFGPQTDIFNDTSRTIHVSFYLGGSDIISFTINRTTMRRTYQVKTDWRIFKLNLTNSFSIDFTQVLATPVEEWLKINETTYTYDNPEISFKFVLPQTATQVHAEGDTITFEVPPYFEDVFLNSPFLILAILVIVIIIALIYRRVR